MPTRSWLRPSFRYGSTSTMPLARRVLARAAASTPREVDRPDHERSLRRVRARTGRRRRSPRPIHRDGRTRRGSARRRTRVRRPRAATRSGRRAGTGWPARACCRSGPCGSSRARSRATGRRAASARRRRPAPRFVRSQPGSGSRARGRRRRRRPSAGRSSTRRARRSSTGRPPAPEVASIRTRLSPRARGRSTATITPGRGLVVGPRDHVGGRVGDRDRRVARLGLDDDRIGQEGGAGRRLGELRRELAVGQVQGTLADEPGGRGVPECGGPAVAQRDLVAVRQGEELAEPGAGSGRRGP